MRTTAADTRRATVPLGHSGIRVRPIGLGCMGMSQSYGDSEADESVRTIRTAVDLGVDFLDTSDIYGASTAAPGAAQPGLRSQRAAARPRAAGPA